MTVRTRIEDVADVVGVSTMTVSRALRGVEGVSEARRREIVRVARELGYAPNRAAQSLAIANSNLIGLSFPSMFDQVFADMLAGMRESLDTAGFEMVLDTSHYSQAREARWVDRMLSWQPAGLVLTGLHHGVGVVERLRAARLPVVEIWHHGPDPIDCCVGLDHRAAGAAVADFLHARGYRRPAYVGLARGTDPRSDERFDGFAARARALGLAEPGAWLAPFPTSFEVGHELMAAIAAERARPDVVFFLNDHLAFGALCWCQTHGVSVPDSMGIVGFNRLDLTNVLPRRLTTVETSRHAMGQAAIRTLIARIRGARVNAPEPMPFAIHDGDTTRSLPAGLAKA